MLNDGRLVAVLTTLPLSSESRQDELIVISSGSVQKYENGEKSIAEIGRELNVTYILQGSVQRQDDRVRVTIKLIDAESEEQVWSRSYDRVIADVFEVQSEIAIKVSQQLAIKLSKKLTDRMSRIPTDNWEAFQLVERAKYLTDHDEALKLLGEALLLDPEFGEAEYHYIRRLQRLPD